MHVKMTTAVLLMALLSGCTGDEEPSFVNGTPAGATPSAIPAPVASAAGAVRSGAKGDLSIAFNGDCVIHKDSKNALWLKLTFSVNWLGATFPATSVSVSADRGGRKVDTAVTSGEPVLVAIGGDPVSGNAFLGQQVVLTVTADPANRVAELSETNNIVKIIATVPAAAPSDNADHVVMCE